jgi:uncharacterized protein
MSSVFAQTHLGEACATLLVSSFQIFQCFFPGAALRIISQIYRPGEGLSLRLWSLCIRAVHGKLEEDDAMVLKSYKTLFAIGAVAMLVLAAGTAGAERISELVASMPQGTNPGSIDLGAPLGYLGIPGAPQVNMLLAFGWSIWVGWIFSSVGAFGGVMAAVGHISIFGLGAYAGSFQKSPLNKSLTDSIRMSNQILALLSGIITSATYISQRRVVLPLAVALGIGSILGSYLSTSLSAGKVSFAQYQGYFGFFVLLLGAYLFYETTPAGLARKQKSTAAAKAFESAVQRLRNGECVDLKCNGVAIVSISLKRVEFTFFGVQFGFNPFLPVLGGFAISAVAAFLGVGGGFMLVPFLTSVAGLPMHLAAGTSALAVVISMVTSLTTFCSLGVTVDWPMMGVEMAGVFAGSLIGPRTARFIKDIWLKRLFILMSLYVGVDYLLRGFFKIKMLG